MKTNHHQLCMALFAVTLLASTAPATLTVYYDSNEFMSAIPDPGYYDAFEFFYGNPVNGQTCWEVPLADGKYWFDAHADHGLMFKPGKPGVLSTYDAGDSLVFTFENSPNDVMSVGGIFASGDNQGNTISQDLLITLTDWLNDVTQVTITGSQFIGLEGVFVGFVSNVVLTRLTIDGVDYPNSNWPQVRLFHADSPEPTTLVLLALGGCTLLRKRRA